MRCRCRRAANPALLRGQIWENICSDKESASLGRGQAQALQLFWPTDTTLL